jgi:hypothetical protein
MARNVVLQLTFFGLLLSYLAEIRPSGNSGPHKKVWIHSRFSDESKLF